MTQDLTEKYLTDNGVEINETQREAIPRINANLKLLSDRTGEQFAIELDEYYLIRNESDNNEIVCAEAGILDIDTWLIEVNKIVSKTLSNIIILITNERYLGQ